MREAGLEDWQEIVNVRDAYDDCRYSEKSREADIDEILKNGPITTSIEEDNTPKIEKLETDNLLLKDWYWKVYDDASGCLKSPTGKSYFSFDWNTREFQINPDDHYSYFGHYDDFGNRLTFTDFKKYAEQYILERIMSLKNNIVMDDDNEEDEEI